MKDAAGADMATDKGADSLHVNSNADITTTGGGKDKDKDKDGTLAAAIMQRMWRSECMRVLPWRRGSVGYAVLPRSVASWEAYVCAGAMPLSARAPVAGGITGAARSDPYSLGWFSRGGAGGDGGGSVAEREAAGQWAAACRGGEVAGGEESLAVDAMLALTAATTSASGGFGVGPGDDTDVDDGDGGEEEAVYGPATANAAARDGLTLLEHCLDGPADPFSLAHGTRTSSSSTRGPPAPHPFPPLGQDDTLLALDRLRDLTTRTLLLQGTT